MNDSKIFAHIAQERAARALVLFFVGSALAAAATGNPGPALALAFGAGLFNAARPGPTADLDRMTGR